MTKALCGRLLRNEKHKGVFMAKLNGDALGKIDEIVARHRNQAGPCIEMLHEVQNELGYIPFEAMEKIAEATGTSVAEVYGVVMFYSQFTTEPKGKHVINVCLGTACYVKGAQQLVDRVEKMTGAAVNKTSADGLFSLDATRCLGACGLAPVCIIDGKVYGNALMGNSFTNELRKIILAEREAKA
jgi:NADH:ubiquinone oxidoreductase subunit E